MGKYLTSGQEAFAATLSRLTGLDRNVVRAWTLAEMSDSYARKRQADGNNNWLNVGYFDSGAANWAKTAFKDPNQAAQLTADFLKGKRWGADQRIQNILSYAGKSPTEQLKAIYSSPWASNHYGNGSALQGTYKLVSGDSVPASSGTTASSPVKAPTSPSNAQGDTRGTFLQVLRTGLTTKGQKAFRSGLQEMVLGGFKGGPTVTTDTSVSQADAPAVNGIVDLAKKYLGTPYSWGGGGKSGPSKGFGRGANTVGFDCSSFIQFLYAKYGVDIPRVTYDQVKVGQKIDRQNLRPGDAVFFAKGGDVGHVGMYIGNGKFIHAPRTGDVIKISSLDDSYYSQHFYGGRRYG